MKRSGKDKCYDDQCGHIRDEHLSNGRCNYLCSNFDPRFPVFCDCSIFLERDEYDRRKKLDENPICVKCLVDLMTIEDYSHPYYMDYLNIGYSYCNFCHKCFNEILHQLEQKELERLDLSQRIF